MTFIRESTFWGKYFIGLQSISTKFVLLDYNQYFLYQRPTLIEMTKSFFSGITLTNALVRRVSNEAKHLKENESGGILRYNLTRIEKSGKMLKNV